MQASSRQRCNKIFISWSGKYSKEIAKTIKKTLEKTVFENTDLECFVSDQDIASGSDWWEKIKKELRKCKLGILCITKENLQAPWLYYEAGAMIARQVDSIPLLVSCNIRALATTPLKGQQAIDFYDQKKFLKMLADINIKMGLGLAETQINILGKKAYSDIKSELETELKKLREMRVFNGQYIYPREVSTIKRNTIFVSAAMSNLAENEYTKLRDCMLNVRESLIQIGFTEVYCPMIDIESSDHFEGKAKAIKNNFPIMKSVDSMIVVYPWKTASSALAEIGYGIALTKRMVIFHGEGLPYMIEEAGSSIANIKTYSFNTYDEIKSIIDSNGMALFESEIGGFDE